MPLSKLKNISYAKNHREIRKIFGKNIEIKCFNNELGEILFKELSLYPEALHEEVDYLIEIVPKSEMKSRLRNLQERDYIIISSQVGDRCFVFYNGKLSHILFSLNAPVNRIHGWIQRIRNMEFNRREERIGQIIHEQVLVPSVLFEPGMVPVHSSAVKLGNQVVLFGGHGGVGKTSLELELCFNKGAQFIADDISVVSASGKVFPNLSYPKIYGYNVEGQPEIKDLIIGSSNFSDRFHWKLHKLKGLNKVRRRISPAELYKNYLSRPEPINRYLILKRYDGDEFKTKKIDTDTASQMSVEILKKEFSGILSQLDQQEQLKSNEFKREAIIERWEKKLPNILDSISCEVVYIPKKFSHQKFKEKMLDIIS